MRTDERQRGSTHGALMNAYDAAAASTVATARIHQRSRSARSASTAVIAWFRVLGSGSHPGPRARNHPQNRQIQQFRRFLARANARIEIVEQERQRDTNNQPDQRPQPDFADEPD